MEYFCRIMKKNWKNMNNYTEFSYGIFLLNNEKKLEKHEIIPILCISTIK